LKKAFIAAGLNGKLATHSLRKSFAQRVYEQSSDIYLVQELLGHRSVNTTQKYLGVNYASARETVEAIALIAERDRTHRNTHSVKKKERPTATRQSLLNITARLATVPHTRHATNLRKRYVQLFLVKTINATRIHNPGFNRTRS
jgi:hypothetical protein